MPLTLPLPDWVPWWVQLAVLVIGVLFALAFLMMPFAVFGLKGRLDFLEAQLDDIHAELRMLAMRLPDLDRPPVRPPAPMVQELEPMPSPPASRSARAPASRDPSPAPLPAPSPVPRRPRDADDWSTEPPAYESDDGPRRPLRARPLRDPDRSRPDASRSEPNRSEPTRSEPTLRWPPR